MIDRKFLYDRLPRGVTRETADTIVGLEGDIQAQNAAFGLSNDNQRFFPYQKTDGEWYIGLGHRLGNEEQMTRLQQNQLNRWRNVGMPESHGYALLANDLDGAQKVANRLSRRNEVTEAPESFNQAVTHAIFTGGEESLTGDFWELARTRDYQGAANSLAESVLSTRNPTIAATIAEGVSSGEGFDENIFAAQATEVTPYVYTPSPTPTYVSQQRPNLVEQTARATALGETGVANFSNQGQISVDTNNSRSYGFLGLNSQDGASAWQFRRDYGRDLGLTADPGTPEFDQQWLAAVENNPTELINAQLSYHEENNVRPAQEQLRAAGLETLADNPGVINYVADSIVQYGPNITKDHWAQVAQQNPQTPETFIQTASQVQDANIVQRDEAGNIIGGNFRSYLTQNPDNEQGLRNRIQRRQESSLGINQQFVEIAASAPPERPPVETAEVSPTSGPPPRTPLPEPGSPPDTVFEGVPTLEGIRAFDRRISDAVTDVASRAASGVADFFSPSQAQEGLDVAEAAIRDRRIESGIASEQDIAAAALTPEQQNAALAVQENAQRVGEEARQAALTGGRQAFDAFQEGQVLDQPVIPIESPEPIPQNQVGGPPQLTVEQSANDLIEEIAGLRRRQAPEIAARREEILAAENERFQNSNDELRRRSAQTLEDANRREQQSRVRLLEDALGGVDAGNAFENLDRAGSVEASQQTGRFGLPAQIRGIAAGSSVPSVSAFQSIENARLKQQRANELNTRVQDVTNNNSLSETERLIQIARANDQARQEFNLINSYTGQGPTNLQAPDTLEGDRLENFRETLETFETRNRALDQLFTGIRDNNVEEGTNLANQDAVQALSLQLSQFLNSDSFDGQLGGVLDNGAISVLLDQLNERRTSDGARAR